MDYYTVSAAALAVDRQVADLEDKLSPHLG